MTLTLMNRPPKQENYPVKIRTRFALAATLAVALATAGFSSTPAPASAHDSVLSTTPAVGSVLTEAPTTITMEFAATLLDIGNVRGRRCRRHQLG